MFKVVGDSDRDNVVLGGSYDSLRCFSVSYFNTHVNGGGGGGIQSSTVIFHSWG